MQPWHRLASVTGKTALLMSLACGVAMSVPAFAAAAIPPTSLVAHPLELPGFATAKSTLHAATTPARYARVVLGERGRQARSEVTRLKRKGFREGVQELLSSPQGEALSAAIVFGSARVATRELKTSVTEGVKAQGKAKLTRFTVASIPGSVGFSAVEAGNSSAAANVFFATGRCFFVVGNSLRKATPEQASSAPIAGASALYQRVVSLCAGR